MAARIVSQSSMMGQNLPWETGERAPFRNDDIYTSNVRVLRTMFPDRPSHSERDLSPGQRM